MPAARTGSFRILVQAYEMLSSARVARASHVDAPAQSRPRAARPRPERSAASRSMPGIHDAGVPPSRIVAVELLCVRYLWDDAEYLWLTQRAPDEERFLSCNLNSPGPTRVRPSTPRRSAIRRRSSSTLHEVFDHMIITTRVVASRSREDEDRFAGWLVLFQLRPRLESRQHAARALAGPRARPATVVARPIHSPRLAVNPSRASTGSARSALRARTA